MIFPLVAHRVFAHLAPFQDYSAFPILNACTRSPFMLRGQFSLQEKANPGKNKVFSSDLAGK